MADIAPAPCPELALRWLFVHGTQATSTSLAANLFTKRLIPIPPRLTCRAGRWHATRRLLHRLALHRPWALRTWFSSYTDL